MLQRAIWIYNVAEVVALLERAELPLKDYENWFSVALDHIYYLRTVNHLNLSIQQKHRLINLSQEAVSTLYSSVQPLHCHYDMYEFGYECTVSYNRFYLRLDLQ